MDRRLPQKKLERKRNFFSSVRLFCRERRISCPDAGKFKNDQLEVFPEFHFADMEN